MSDFKDSKGLMVACMLYMQSVTLLVRISTAAMSACGNNKFAGRCGYSCAIKWMSSLRQQVKRWVELSAVLLLAQFEGGVVVISHDSQLLSRVCDDAERSEVWLVEDGQVQRYDGYFEEYKEELIKEISAEMDED